MGLRAGLHGTVAQSTSALLKGSTLFESYNQAYLKKSLSAMGNRRRWTMSTWMKIVPSSYSNINHRCWFGADAGSSDIATRILCFAGDASDQLQIDTNVSMRDSSSVYRDPTGWYHHLITLDTTETTARNQLTYYINGSVVDTWNTEASVTQYQQMGWMNENSTHLIGANQAAGPGQYFAGQMCDLHCIDGSVVGPEYFGYTDPLTGSWRPKKVIAPGPNKGQNWAGMCSGSTNAGNGYEKAFDGADDENCYPAPGSTVTMTIPAGQLKWTTSFEVWVSRDLNGGNITVNGGSAVVPPGHSFHIVDLTGEVAAGADITEITWDRAGSGSIGIAMYYIVIDGVALFDNDTSNYGGQGFHLPFDGETYIGEDRSGRGNNWEPVNFGGSTFLDKATGGIPILNTSGGGKISSSGVRKDFGPDTAPIVKESGCVAFDGSSDSLFCEDGAGVRFGTSDFTVEGWIYIRSYTDTYPTVISKYDNSDSSWILRPKSDGKIVWYAGQVSGGTNNTSASAVLSLRTWHHVAVCREGTGTNETKVYVDGSLVLSCTDTSDYDDTNDIYIGRQDVTNTNYFDGFISNIRIVNGTAVYTADFTPSGQPLENITNTKLLCCQSSEYVGAAATAPTMGGLNDGTNWSQQGSFYTGSIWSDPQDTGGSGSFWPGSMFTGQASGHANNVGPYNSGVLTISFGKTWEGSTDFTIYGRLYQSDLYKDQDGNTLYTQGASDSGTIMDRTFTASNVNQIIVDQQSGNGNSSFVASISVEGEKLRDPLNRLPGSTSNKPFATASETSGCCSLAIPFNGQEKDVSNWVNSNSTAKSLTANGSNLSTVRQNNFWYGYGRKWAGVQSYYDVASSSDMAFGTGDFCMEMWVRHYTNMGSLQVYMTDQSGNSNGIFLAKNSSSQVYVYYTSTILTGSTVLQEDRWYHVAYVRDNGTSKIYIDGKEDASVSDTFNLTEEAYYIGDTNSPHVGTMYGYMQDVRCYKGTAKYYKEFTPASPYPEARRDSPSGVSLGGQLATPTYSSVSFTEGETPYMDFDPGSDIAIGTGDFTIEAFVYHVGGADDVIISDNAGCSFLYGATGTLRFYMASGSNLVSATPAYISYEWVHVAAVRTNGTLKMFQDGKEVYSASYTHNISTFTNPTDIGSYHSGASYWNGFINSLRVTVGQALYTTDYEPPSEPLTTTSQNASASNVKLLCCQDPVDPTAATVTPNAITAYGNVRVVRDNPFDANQLDVKPTVYPTLNPLCCTQSGGTGPEEYSDGLLYIKGDGDTGYYDMCACASQLLPLEGKYMFEYECANTAGTGSPGRRDSIGVYDTSKQQDYLTNIANSVGFQSWDGDAVTEESDVQGEGMAWSAGDIASCAIDCSTGKVWFATNGVWVGDPSKGTGQATTLTNNGHLAFCQSNVHNSTSGGYDSRGWLNFGQKSFAYTPPEGFGPLCAANKIPPLGNPQEYTVAIEYAGNNGVNQIDCGFAPDLVICKAYSTGSYHWAWYDTVRGPGTTKSIYSSDTQIEGYYADYMNLQEFIPSGFILGATSNTNVINAGSVNNVAYGFKAGGSKGTFNRDGVGHATAAAAGLSAGDTTINGASVGTKQGFSIIHYTGPNDTSNHTVAHGLNQAPDLVIVKNLDDTVNWNVYHSFFDSGDYMTMTADATTTDGFNGVPSSTVINTQHGYSTDENDEFIAYCWHDVDGLQKVGKYISNNNSNGPMVYTGFRPCQVVLRLDGADGWHVYDNKRDPNNGIASRIWWNSSASASSGVFLDFLADGFKLRTSDSGVNGSSGTNYYFIAWADQSPGQYGAQPNAY